MKKSLREHIAQTEKILAEEKDAEKIEYWRDYNRVRIGFFQHERLIHLLVTIFIAWLFASILFVILIFPSLLLAAVDVILLTLLVFYIAHYYTLENGVQKLYELDRQLEKKF